MLVFARVKLLFFMQVSSHSHYIDLLNDHILTFETKRKFSTSIQLGLNTQLAVESVCDFFADEKAEPMTLQIELFTLFVCCNEVFLEKIGLVSCAYSNTSILDTDADIHSFIVLWFDFALHFNLFFYRRKLDRV